MLTEKEIKKMSYSELEEKVQANRALYSKVSRAEARALRNESFDCMAEMERRYQAQYPNGTSTRVYNRGTR